MYWLHTAIRTPIHDGIVNSRTWRTHAFAPTWCRLYGPGHSLSDPVHKPRRCLAIPPSPPKECQGTVCASRVLLDVRCMHMSCSRVLSTPRRKLGRYCCLSEPRPDLERNSPHVLRAQLKRRFTKHESLRLCRSCNTLDWFPASLHSSSSHVWSIDGRGFLHWSPY